MKVYEIEFLNIVGEMKKFDLYVYFFEEEVFELFIVIWI